MIFDREFEKRDVNINEWKKVYNSENGYEITPFNDEIKEITYFSCLRILSESVAKCPIQVKKEAKKGETVVKAHPLYDLLRLRPNKYMSAIDCIKTFIVLAEHEGKAGLYINRNNKGKIEGLYPVKINSITVDNAGLIKGTKNNKILYDFVGVNGEYGSCFEKNIILLKGFTLDGINTKSIKNILRENLDTSINSQKYLNKLFKNGMTNKLVVQLTSDIKDEKEMKKIQKKFDRIYKNNGRIFTVPAGYNVSPLDLKLADAQYEQLRRLSKEELAGAMGVPLTKLGFTKENAKSEEQDNLKFYTDTLLVLFEQIEQEMDYKLLTDIERKEGYKIRFNVGVLLRTDSKTQAEVINSYVKNGVYSLNKAKGILGIETLDKDVTLFPSGQVTLDALLNGQASWQKDNKNIGE